MTLPHAILEARIEALTKSCDEIIVEDMESAVRDAKVRHNLAERIIHLERCSNQCAEIALDACCPHTHFLALLAACALKSAAATYREDPASSEVWLKRAERFETMEEDFRQRMEALVKDMLRERLAAMGKS